MRREMVFKASVLTGGLHWNGILWVPVCISNLFPFVQLFVLHPLPSLHNYTSLSVLVPFDPLYLWLSFVAFTVDSFVTSFFVGYGWTGL